MRMTKAQHGLKAQFGTTAEFTKDVLVAQVTGKFKVRYANKLIREYDRLWKDAGATHPGSTGTRQETRHSS